MAVVKATDSGPIGRNRGLGFTVALGLADQHADSSQAIKLLRVGAKAT